VTVNLHDLLFDVLGYGPEEFVSVNTLPPGGVWKSAVVPVADAPGLVDILGTSANVYYGVNPVQRMMSGRGSYEDITRMAAIWIDLDFKSGGCGSPQTARKVMADVSSAVGVQPSVIVRSGGGLQPLWPIEDFLITDADSRQRAAAALHRFGELVRRVASSHGCKVDSVFDLPRVLRVPGSFNHRYGEPIEVVGEQAPGAPMSIDELEQRLDEFGIPEAEGDMLSRLSGTTAPVVSVPDEWAFATERCGYVIKTLEGWAGDVPTTGRHPWLVGQMVRLVGMHRRGCLTEEDYRRGYDILDSRFRQMCADGISGEVRTVPPNEVPDALAFAIAKVSAMSDGHLRKELGDHLHLSEMAEGVPMTLQPRADSAPVQPHSVPVQSAGQVDDEDEDDFSGLIGTSTTISGAADDDEDEQFNPSMTDTGAADLLVLRHRDHLRYCPDMAKWLRWTGHLWAPQADDSASYRAARETVEAINADSVQKVKFKFKNLSAAKLSAISGLARRHQHMQIDVAELDSDPYLINTKSGVVDLQTGTLLPPTASGFHTRSCGVGYDPLAPRPLWNDFLNDTFGGDPVMISYIQRLCGLTALGEVREEILPFLYGVGKNGKTQFLETIQKVLGTYAIIAPINFLMAGRGEKHETEIARLRGARLVVASEVNQGSKFDEGKVKVLTGGDTLTGRFMYQDGFDFEPSHTLWLMGNYQPSVEAGGPSFWRRLRLIHFGYTVPHHKRVAKLSKVLVQQEGDAIMAWIVEGAMDVLKFGVATPKSVEDATEEYARQEDHMGRFVEECLVVGQPDSEKVANSALAHVYTKWCRENNEDEMPMRQVGRELTARFNIGTAKGHGGTRFRTGLNIQPDAVPNFLMDGRVI
jgi:P4 family phage/plasmid primase-like protien